MKDFRACHVSGPFPAGSYGFHGAGPGCYRVEYDSQAWTYRVARGERRAFRAWVASAFPPNNGERYKVTGRYPDITIEKVQP